MAVTFEKLSWNVFIDIQRFWIENTQKGNFRMCIKMYK